MLVLFSEMQRACERMGFLKRSRVPYFAIVSLKHILDIQLESKWRHRKDKPRAQR